MLLSGRRGICVPPADGDRTCPTRETVFSFEGSQGVTVRGRSGEGPSLEVRGLPSARKRPTGDVGHTGVLPRLVGLTDVDSGVVGAWSPRPDHTLVGVG